MTVFDALARERPTSADSQASIAMVETRYQATILEVLKSEDHDIETGVPISIVLPIGEGVDARVAIHRSELGDMKPLVLQREYVVFLERPATFPNCYRLANGPAGVFPIDGPSVEIPSRVRNWEAFAGKSSVSLTAFLAALRQMRDRS